MILDRELTVRGDLGDFVMFEFSSLAWSSSFSEMTLSSDDFFLFFFFLPLTLTKCGPLKFQNKA